MSTTLQSSPAVEREREHDVEDEKGSEQYQMKQSPKQGPEDIKSDLGNLAYANEDEEPEFHARTWFALAALFFLNYVQLVALTGPPVVVSFCVSPLIFVCSRGLGIQLDYLGEDLDATAVQTWVPNALSLVQAVGGPIIVSRRLSPVLASIGHPELTIYPVSFTVVRLRHLPGS